MIRLGTALAAGCIAFSVVGTADKAEARDLFDDFFNRQLRTDDDPGANDRGGFWSIFSSSRRSEPVVIEPEKPYVAPVYQPDVLQPLRDAALEAERPESALHGAVYDVLKDGVEPVVRVHPDHKKPIIAFYSERGFRPLWTIEGGLSLRAERLLSLLAKADDEGLRAGDYLPEALGAFDKDERTELDGAIDLARLDVELTVAALKYAQHASAGRIVPERLSKYVDIHPEAVPASDALQALGRTVRPETYLAGLHPRHPAYGAFKAELAKLRAEADRQNEIIVPQGGLLKLNSVDERVVTIRAKLKSLDLLDTEVTSIASEFEAATEADLIDTEKSSDDSPVYDKAVWEAVRLFQKQAGLSADGVVGPATTRAMNTDTSGERLEKLVLNIERLRWMPEDFGVTDRRYVLVNQASFQLKLFENREIIHKTRVIVGKLNHQTPSFSDEMEFVVLNPYWNVPRSIATKEMLPHLIANPRYLDEKGFEVVGRSGKVRSASVDWEDYEGQYMPYDFRQPPGAGNALGIVKFLFPNHHNVYLHDTPTKHLFSQPVRAYSHGCVRVHNADKFADVILGGEGWTPGRIRNAIGTGENQRIVMQKKVQVHIAYFTAWSDGADTSYYKDLYGLDDLLKRALGENRVAMK